MMDLILILALAAVIDLALGDPPNALHPVAWMGTVISLLERAGIKLSAAGQFIYGIGMTLFTTALFVATRLFPACLPARCQPDRLYYRRRRSAQDDLLYQGPAPRRL